MAERRDLSDRRLVRPRLERRLPLLGIGLGMQQINVALGGTLLMHLPEDLPRAMPHYDASGGPHRHTVLLEPGMRMEEIYGGRRNPRQQLPASSGGAPGCAEHADLYPGAGRRD